MRLEVKGEVISPVVRRAFTGYHEGTLTVAIPERNLAKEFTFQLTGVGSPASRLTIRKGEMVFLTLVGKFEPAKAETWGAEQQTLFPVFSDIIRSGALKNLDEYQRLMLGQPFFRPKELSKDGANRFIATVTAEEDIADPQEAERFITACT
jgi:hypothetical protein